MKITIRKSTAPPEQEEAIIRSVKDQKIYWSDVRNTHFIFDYQFGQYWVSSVNITNELDEIVIDIY